MHYVFSHLESLKYFPSYSFSSFFNVILGATECEEKFELKRAFLL